MLFKRKSNTNGRPNQLSTGGGFGGDNSSNYDPWGDLFKSAGFDNAVKHLYEPVVTGEVKSSDFHKILGRTVFAFQKPPNLNDVINCARRYVRFGQWRHLESLIALLEGAPSIAGQARSEMLMGITHIIAENAMQHGQIIRSGQLPSSIKGNGDGKVRMAKGQGQQHYPEDNTEE